MSEEPTEGTETPVADSVDSVDQGALAALVAEIGTLKAQVEALKQEAVVEPVAHQPVDPQPVDPTLSILERAGMGSIFEKAAHGWTVKFVDGSIPLTGQGRSIADAVQSVGVVV